MPNIPGESLSSSLSLLPFEVSGLLPDSYAAARRDNFAWTFRALGMGDDGVPVVGTASSAEDGGTVAERVELTRLPELGPGQRMELRLCAKVANTSQTKNILFFPDIFHLFSWAFPTVPPNSSNTFNTSSSNNISSSSNISNSNNISSSNNISNSNISSSNISNSNNIGSSNNISSSIKFDPSGPRFKRCILILQSASASLESLSVFSILRSLTKDPEEDVDLTACRLERLLSTSPGIPRPLANKIREALGTVSRAWNAHKRLLLISYHMYTTMHTGIVWMYLDIRCK